jgi:hypothetical protein
MAIKLQRVFVVTLLAYSILCIGITVLCVLDKSLRYVDLKAAAAASEGIVGSYEILGISSVSFERWFRKCQRLASKCTSLKFDNIVQCSSKIGIQATDLFFMYVYLPLWSMVAAFIAHMLLWRTPGSSKGGKSKKRSNNIPTEMPPLQACYMDDDELSLSRELSADSCEGDPASPTHAYLIFDETFGIIEKSIIDGWGSVDANIKSMIGTAATNGLYSNKSAPGVVNPLQKRRIFPPVRNSTASKSADRTINPTISTMSSTLVPPNTSVSAPLATSTPSPGRTAEKRKKNTRN